MNKIKTGDQVIVIAGKDQDKTGTVRTTHPNGKVTVEGINIARKHVKPNPNANNEGGIVEQEMPIDQSNLAIYNSNTQSKDKVAMRRLEDGKKVRCYKTTGEMIDV